MTTRLQEQLAATARERERMEALGDEIAALAAHMEAAMCRWLGLVARYDESGAWAEHGCRSCAEWLGYRCSLNPGTAREHVRVARRLCELPLVRASFSRGELSYSKVRAITRLEEVTREAELLELARYMTASQLERTVRGWRRVVAAEAHRAHEERFLSVIHAEDGSVLLRGKLSREEGAVVMKALEAMRDKPARASAETPFHESGVSAEASERLTAGMRDADALVAMADAALVAPARAERTGGDRHQVVVHVDAPTLAGCDPGGRCELDDRAPLSIETTRRLCCDAAIVPIIERNGQPLSVGRKTRSIPPALRRALRSRDQGCRFPGCNHHRRVDGHHIVHWSNGGETSLENVVSLCRFHHRLVHEGGYAVEKRAHGALCFRRPDGRAITPTPKRVRGDHTVPARHTHGAGLTITPETLKPGWLGEPLELGYAVDAFLGYTDPPALRPDPDDDGGPSATQDRR